MSDGAIFSPSSMSLTVNSVPIRGRIGGEFLTFAWSKPQWFTMTAGVDGVGYYVLSEDRGGTVTVRVQPNSVENDALNEILGLTIASKARVPITVKRGRTVLVGLGLVLGLPGFSFSDGTMQNEWSIASTFWAGAIGGQAGAVLGA